MQQKIDDFIEVLKEKPISESVFKNLVAHYNDFSTIILEDVEDRKFNYIYMEQLVKCIRIVDTTLENKNIYYNIVKTTRASCTTNIIIAALIRSKKILVVEPTNQIASSTVFTALEIYQKSSGDYTKIVRQIPSNQLGCSKAKAKIVEEEGLKELPFILSENCKDCEIPYYSQLFEPKMPFSTPDRCYIKTMMTEKKMSQNVRGCDYVPDVLTITYDKLLSIKRGDKVGEKASFYTDLIAKMDIIFFDEIGQYLSDFQGGIDIQIKKIDNVHNKVEITDITKMQIEFARYLYKLKDNGYNFKKIDNLLEMIKIYFRDFIKDTCKKYTDKDDNKEIDLLNPLYVKNSLSTLPTTISVKRGNIKKKMIVSKLEAIQSEFSKYYVEMEDILVGKSQQNAHKVEWALKMLQLIQDDEFVIYKRRFPDMEKEGIEHEITTIYPTTENVLKAIESWTEGKTVLFTDATMPAYYLENFSKYCHSLHFGDPAQTNSQLLLVNDKSDGIYDFSVKRWNSSIGYKKVIIDRICEMIYYFNFYKYVPKDKDSGIVIWTPNKLICDDVYARLAREEINYEKIKFCTLEDYMKFIDDEKNNYHLVRGKVLVTYYGSPLTRGVKCDRRVQILLGKANKPLDSYKHVAYMQRKDWKPFTDRDIAKFAEEEKMSVEDFTAMLDKFKNGYKVGERIIKIKEVPKPLIKILRYQGMSIQNERTNMDTWQAASRAKDSEGKTRSVLICLGWKHKDIWELIKWGDSENVKYLPIFSDRGGLVRYAVKQEHLIAPPSVSKVENDYKPIMDWLYGKDVELRNVGFDIDLYFGILDMLSRKEEVSSEEVWLELSKNLKIGNYDEDYRNGYMVGSINAYLIYGMDSIETIKETNARFVFKRKNEEVDVERNIKMMYTDYEILEDVINFLRHVFKYKKDYVYVGSIANSNNIDKDKLEKIIHFIEENKIIDGSSWKIINENNSYRIVKNIKPKNAEECKVEVKTKKAQILLTSKINCAVLDVVLGWYNNSDEYMLKIKDIKEEVNKNIVLNTKEIKEILRKIFPTDASFKQFHLDGCKLYENGNIMMIIKP